MPPMSKYYLMIVSWDVEAKLHTFLIFDTRQMGVVSFML
jgi:hypothetical protein